MVQNLLDFLHTIIIIKRGWQCTAGRERLTPYQCYNRRYKLRYNRRYKPYKHPKASNFNSPSFPQGGEIVCPGVPVPLVEGRSEVSAVNRAGSLVNFVDVWNSITKNKVVLDIASNCHIDLVDNFPPVQLFCPRQ